VGYKKLSKWISEVGQKNQTPHVVRNPTPTPPKNLRHLATPTPQPWQVLLVCSA